MNRKWLSSKTIHFLLVLIFIISNATILHASGDIDCPTPLTALINNTSALQCSAGIGNAVLNPYNDTQINLLLAMTRPASNQKFEKSKDLSLDAAADVIKSPFFIQAFETISSSEDECNKKFDELLNQYKLNKGSLKSNSQYNGKSLACRAMELNEIIKSDTVLNEADRRQIISHLLFTTAEPATANTKQYFNYIDAADAFYADDYNKAEQIFSTLANTGSNWVKEASLYNLIRVKIRKAQRQSHDGYGFFDIQKVDKNEAGKIIPAIQKYLKVFPKGRYANSAENLKRYAYWLINDSNNLLKSYSSAITFIRHNNDFAAAAKLAMEIEHKYLFTSLDQIDWDNPFIASAKILIRLRKPAPDDNKKQQYNPVNLAEIQSHESNFKKQNAFYLYQYLLVAYDYFKEENYESVLQKTKNWKDNLAQADFASFSIAALRAEALGKLKRWQEAESLLKELRELSPSPLLKDHFELAQAQNLEASGNLKKIFEPDSIIQSPVLRKRLLRASADTPLLEYVLNQKHTTSEEKSVALAALLTKELFSTRYKSLLEHQNKYAASKLDNVDGLDLLRNEDIISKDKYLCQKWSKVLQDMNSDKKPSQALLCLGERMRQLEDGSVIPQNPYTNELGNCKDSFETKKLTRLSLYLAVIDDPSAKYDDKAFALRRALNCFATTGYNHCGDETIPTEKRRSWFLKLKSDYKKSPWATKQKYYW